MTVFVPKCSSSTGVLMKLEHDQTFLLEWYGEYVTVSTSIGCDP